MKMYEYIVMGDEILGSFKSPAKALDLAKAMNAKVLAHVEDDYDLGSHQKFYTIKNKIYVLVKILDIWEKEFKGGYNESS